MKGHNKNALTQTRAKTPVSTALDPHYADKLHLETWQRPFASIQVMLVDEQEDVQISLAREHNFDFRSVACAVSSAQTVVT